jgi:hypothetical protein
LKVCCVRIFRLGEAKERRDLVAGDQSIDRGEFTGGPLAATRIVLGIFDSDGKRLSLGHRQLPQSLLYSASYGAPAGLDPSLKAESRGRRIQRPEGPLLLPLESWRRQPRGSEFEADPHRGVVQIVRM